MGSFSGWASDERSSRRRRSCLGLHHHSRPRAALAIQPLVGARRPVGEHVRFPRRSVVERQRIDGDLRGGPAPDRAAPGRSAGRRLRGDHCVGTPRTTGQPTRRAYPTGRHGASRGGSSAETPSSDQTQQGRSRAAPALQTPTLPGQGRTRTRDFYGVAQRDSSHIHSEPGRSRSSNDRPITPAAPAAAAQPTRRALPCCQRCRRARHPVGPSRAASVVLGQPPGPGHD